VPRSGLGVCRSTALGAPFGPCQVSPQAFASLFLVEHRCDNLRSSQPSQIRRMGLGGTRRDDGLGWIGSKQSSRNRPFDCHQNTPSGQTRVDLLRASSRESRPSCATSLSSAIPLAVQRLRSDPAVGIRPQRQLSRRDRNSRKHGHNRRATAFLRLRLFRCVRKFPLHYVLPIARSARRIRGVPL
jgi:hypothetical protein